MTMHISDVSEKGAMDVATAPLSRQEIDFLSLVRGHGPFNASHRVSVSRIPNLT
jgi:hypothetical protein